MEDKIMLGWMVKEIMNLEGPDDAYHITIGGKKAVILSQKGYEKLIETINKSTDHIKQVNEDLKELIKLQKKYKKEDKKKC